MMQRWEIYEGRKGRRNTVREEHESQRVREEWKERREDGRGQWVREER